MPIAAIKKKAKGTPPVFAKTPLAVATTLCSFFLPLIATPYEIAKPITAPVKAEVKPN